MSVVYWSGPTMIDATKPDSLLPKIEIANNKDLSPKAKVRLLFGYGAVGVFGYAKLTGGDIKEWLWELFWAPL